MFDVSIFRVAVFNYFCLHCMLFHISFNVPYVYVPLKAASLEISKEGTSTLVAIIGISSTVGQVDSTTLNVDRISCVSWISCMCIDID